MLKIGPLCLRSQTVLAPLAGISDSAFRLTCREFGAELTFVEMINVRAVSQNNKKTMKMLRLDPKDRPLGVQLLGCEVDYIKKALAVVSRFPFEILDFNAACPVKKVCRRGEGAALMKDPAKLRAILRCLVKESPWPVTIKLRSGWDQNSLNAPQLARMAQDEGIRAVFIHGRDKGQFYSGQADYRVIRRVKQECSIPVIGSGDIWSAVHAKRMRDETGCDGVLVARGALGHPWIFREIHSYFNDGTLAPPPAKEEILKTFVHHLELSIAEHGEKQAVKIMRKFLGWYLKGHPHVRNIRQQTQSFKTRKEYIDLIKNS